MVASIQQMRSALAGPTKRFANPLLAYTLPARAIGLMLLADARSLKSAVKLRSRSSGEFTIIGGERNAAPSERLHLSQFLMEVPDLAFIIGFWSMIPVCNNNNVVDTYLDHEQTRPLSPERHASDEVCVVQLAIPSFTTRKKLTGGPTFGA